MSLAYALDADAYKGRLVSEYISERHLTEGDRKFLRGLRNANISLLRAFCDSAPWLVLEREIAQLRRELIKIRGERDGVDNPGNYQREP